MGAVGVLSQYTCLQSKKQWEDCSREQKCVDSYILSYVWMYRNQNGSIYRKRVNNAFAMCDRSNQQVHIKSVFKVTSQLGKIGFSLDDVIVTHSRAQRRSTSFLCMIAHWRREFQVHYSISFQWHNFNAQFSNPGRWMILGNQALLLLI